MSSGRACPWPLLPRCPARADSRRLADGLDFPPDVSRVQGTARSVGEDQVVVVPLPARGEPFGCLPVLVGPERVHRHLRQGPSVRRDFSVLVSPWDRTERHTAALADTGGWATGSPKVTCSQRSALASSVRMPVARHREMYACILVPSAASSADACCRVRLLLGRPDWPLGVSTRVATLRATRSRASACRMARVSALWPMATAALE